jgi:hypothetical protein
MTRKKPVLRHVSLFVLPVFAAIICAGCLNVGYGRVAGDRFGYTDAISDSWKRQMLLNMVKIRYSDPPVFLEVASVISQYGLETEVQGHLGWNELLPKPSQGVNARSRYVDRPTITYQPLTGRQFTRSMMTPIPPEALMSLIEAGWRADSVLRVCVQSINGIYNRSGGRLEPKPADPEFYILTDLMLRIQDARAVGVRIENPGQTNSSGILFFREKNIAPDIASDVKEFKRMLGLDPNASEFTIVYGAIPADNRQIAVLSRWMLMILGELASYINAPETDVSEGRVTGNFSAAADVAAGLAPIMQVESSEEKPENAFASVEYRDRWFWIDDRDYQSKKVFSFIMFLFTLAETGAPQQGPIITVPTS